MILSGPEDLLSKEIAAPSLAGVVSFTCKIKAEIMYRLAYSW